MYQQCVTLTYLLTYLPTKSLKMNWAFGLGMEFVSYKIDNIYL